ncbi:MAG: hypothetical protein IPL99_20075 [Candidatus Competibacteraceae bacterium]|nr:hypothetical protein [Candidatus Competibacteraceae bacterium]
MPARKGAPGITVTAILAREERPPAGQNAVEWRLLTHRIARIAEAVVELIEWYRRRWLVEIFQDFEIGCRVGPCNWGP